MNNIKDLIKNIEKDIGFTGLISTLEETKDVSVISTGLPSLDKIIGIGGIPRGLITEIYGNTGSTKSSLCLSIITEAQKIGLKCAYIDMELAMAKELAKKIGVNIKDMLYAQPVSGESAMSLTESFLDNGIKLIIIDSVSAMVPEDELERDMNQDSIGLQARMISKFMRKIIGKVKSENAALIFINQIRDDIGKFGFGPKTNTSGGKALKFYSSLRLECARTGWITNSNKEKSGMTIKFLIAKNKLAKPQLQTSINFYFDNGFAIDEDKLNIALETGEFTMIGRTYYAGDVKIGDRNAALEHIKNN